MPAPFMGAEDFSYVLQRMPGCMMFLGVMPLGHDGHVHVEPCHSNRMLLNEEAMATGIAAAGKGATVVQFTATPPDDDLIVHPHDLYFNETKLVPSYSCGPDDTRIALDLVERGVINARELVTHRFPLAKISDAYATAQKPESLKVIVTFG
jgi:threonine dehydrogenase-like Zn-dependent dehydrogenase